MSADAETTAFLTLKDHKPDFKNHTKCRLINPAKSDVGKISKSILDTVNSKIRKQTGVNQWRNSSDTIAWFQSIPLKIINLICQLPEDRQPA